MSSKQYHRDYYLEHREKAILASKKNYWDNRDARRKQHKEWAEKNRDHVKELQNRYRLNHRLLRALNVRQPDWRYRSAVRSSKKRGIEFNIPFPIYKSLIEMPCFYCGGDCSGLMGVGLDRKNNSLGYSVENVCSCCGDCNRVKNSILTHEEMVVAMRAVLDFRKSPDALR